MNLNSGDEELIRRRIEHWTRLRDNKTDTTLTSSVLPPKG